MNGNIFNENQLQNDITPPQSLFGCIVISSLVINPHVPIKLAIAKLHRFQNPELSYSLCLSVLVWLPRIFCMLRPCSVSGRR